MRQFKKVEFMALGIFSCGKTKFKNQFVALIF